MRLFEVKYNYPTSYPYVVVVNHKFWFKVFLDHVHKNFYKKIWNKYQSLDVDEIKVTCDEMYNRCVKIYVTSEEMEMDLLDLENEWYDKKNSYPKRKEVKEIWYSSAKWFTIFNR